MICNKCEHFSPGWGDSRSHPGEPDECSHPKLCYLMTANMRRGPIRKCKGFARKMTLAMWKRAHSEAAHYDYDHCKACGVELDADTKERSHRKLEALYCSGCQHLSMLMTYGCCPMARYRNCCCLCSTTCPVHGDRCHGTHD